MVEIQIISCDVSTKRKGVYWNSAFLFLRNIGVVNQVGRLQIILNFGKIVKSGGKELAYELEEKGYDWIKAELEV